MNRYILPDALRTIAIVLMVVFHIIFDLSSFWGFGINMANWTWLARITGGLFLFVVGMTFYLGNLHKRKPRSYRIRIAQIGGSALLITIVTLIMLPDMYIRFGILHLIAVSLLLLPLFSKLHPFFTAMCGITVIAAGKSVSHISAPHNWLIALGITRPDFATLDYYPIFPWFGWVLLGLACAPMLFQSLPQTYDRHSCNRILLFLGRHALVIYLVHQPILIAILAAIFGVPFH